MPVDLALRSAVKTHGLRTLTEIYARCATSVGALTEQAHTLQHPRAFPGMPEIEGDTLVADSSPLSEVLNVAWAMHEIFSDADKEMFKWFSKHNTPAAV